ncbi:MAG: VOC family protein [Bacteroidales bacterium]|jgi:predicted 3-demethylubiquinone-9 3-methyltransferase (glyoxalase superfamily)
MKGLSVFFYDSESVTQEFRDFGLVEFNDIDEPIKHMDNEPPLKQMNRFFHILLLTFIIASCSNLKTDNSSVMKAKGLEIENDSFKKVIDMKKPIAVFLTFQESNAEQAMNFYVELFPNSKIVEIQRYEKGGPAKEGTIMKASFELNGQPFICSDSYVIHEWTFTPAVSVFVECESNGELEKLFSKLSENGKVMMPLDNYGFSQKFGFVEDKFGVSWQLNLR